MSLDLGTRRFTSGRGWVIALIFVLFLRSGADSFGALESHVSAGVQFPDVDAYFRSSWLHFGLWHLLGISSSYQAVVLSLALITMLAVLTWRFTRNLLPETEADLAFGLIMLSPIMTVLLLHLGIYDVLMMLGTVVMVGSNSIFLSSLGALMMFGANFELSLVAALGLFVLSFSSDLNLDWRKTSISLAVGAGVSVVGLLALYGTLTGGDSRTSWLQHHARGALVNFVVTFPLMTLSFFGVAWLAVAGFVSKSSSRRNAFIHLTSLVVLPAIASALTLDGTRVFVCASSPALLALLLRGRMEPSRILPSFVNRRNLLIVALFVPAVMVHFGEVKLPYQVLYGRL